MPKCWNLQPQFSGRLLYQQDRFGYLRILARDNLKEEAADDTRVVFAAKDFSEVFNCRRADSVFFDQCRVVDKSQFKVSYFF